jgi:hypothetical protein
MLSYYHDLHGDEKKAIKGSRFLLLRGLEKGGPSARSLWEAEGFPLRIHPPFHARAPATAYDLTSRFPGRTRFRSCPQSWRSVDAPSLTAKRT